MDHENVNEQEQTGAGRSDEDPPAGYGGEALDRPAESGRKSGETKPGNAETERQEAGEGE